MIECMRNVACEHMTLDEQISFCEEKSKNIKLKAEPQTFIDIKNSLEKLKKLRGKKMTDKQSNLTDKEMEDLKNIVTDTLANVCAMADKHNIDRDSMLKYFADMLTALTEVASIQNYETNHTCNCKHNSNSRDNEPCCRCDSKVSENDDTKNKVTSLEIIVRMIDNKPYYEIKYKKVGEDYCHVGYSSFNIDNVLKWCDECFELVDVKATNADRIRNMSDEELAEFLITFKNTFVEEYDGEVCCMDWLQSEAE